MASFVAARDIDPGEQLFVSYIEAESMGVAARRQMLRYSYGFNCACPLCVEEGDEAVPAGGAD